MPKTAISAKVDQGLLEEANRIAHELKIPRNRALSEGLRLWVNSKTKENLATKMKKASLAVRKESTKVSKE